MDASAIMQNDTSIENLRAMTETCRDLGVYSAGSYAPPTAWPPAELPEARQTRAGLDGLTGRPAPQIPPGICVPWAEKVRELPEVTGDPDLVRDIWNEIEGLSHFFL